MSWCFSLQWFVCTSLLLFGCEFDGSTFGTASQADGSPFDSTPVTPLTIAAEPLFTVVSVKTFHFEWNDVQGATHYQLLEDADGESGLTQVGEDILQGAQELDLVVPLHGRLNAEYALRSCNSAGCLESGMLSVAGSLISGIGYIKSADTHAVQCFGDSVALSGDGKTLAVGASGRNSMRFCGNGESEDASVGEVYLFEWEAGTWQQTYRFDPNNGDLGDYFGWALALSHDGNTLAVGAFGEDSAATGIGGNEADDSAANSGAAYIFKRGLSGWDQSAYLKPSYTEASDRFGFSVALSNDGLRLAVGAIRDDSGATEVDGDPSDGSQSDSGAVYVFRDNVSVWIEEAYVKASVSDVDDFFGWSVELSGDGATLAVGTRHEDSSAIGVDGDANDNASLNSGAVHVYSRQQTTWTHQAYIKASNTDTKDHFGYHLALDDTGDTLVVGALGEDGDASSEGEPGTDNNNVNLAGAVYVFSRSAQTWTQEAYLKADVVNPASFGWSVDLAATGDSLVVGAPGEKSAASGVGADPSNQTAEDAGAAYVFRKVAGVWRQQAFLKASNAEEYDLFGWAVTISDDGETIAVGANLEDGSTTEIGGTPNDDSFDSGAVYLF